MHILWLCIIADRHGVNASGLPRCPVPGQPAKCADIDRSDDDYRTFDSPGAISGCLPRAYSPLVTGARCWPDWGGHDDQGLADPPPARSARDARRGKRGEARLPPAVAVLVAIALYAVLPETLVLWPRVLIPGLELVLLIALIATNPQCAERACRAAAAALCAAHMFCGHAGRVSSDHWDRMSGPNATTFDCAEMRCRYGDLSGQ